MSSDAKLREEICRTAASLFARGYTHGSTGNISTALEDGWLVTPTGSSFGELDPARLSRLDPQGRPVDGDPPTKEVLLHLSVYRSRPRAAAIVHLHASHSVALSCLDGLDPDDALPPLTAYGRMQCGRVGLVPYFPPGDAALARAVGERAREHFALILAHHGPILAGVDLRSAGHAIEELEATARLALLLDGRAHNRLDAEQLAELDRRFPPSA
jgi:ribulose-5-phosphate 4-epimerase/fuculose-1-phosphate aldolase